MLSCNALSIKTIPIMAAWKFNWTAAHAVHGENVYFASQPLEDGGLSGRASLPAAMPRVLALAPSMSFAMDGVPGFGPRYLKVRMSHTSLPRGREGKVAY